MTQDATTSLVPPIQVLRPIMLLVGIPNADTTLGSHYIAGKPINSMGMWSKLGGGGGGRECSCHETLTIQLHYETHTHNERLVKLKVGVDTLQED